MSLFVKLFFYYFHYFYFINLYFFECFHYFHYLLSLYACFSLFLLVFLNCSAFNIWLVRVLNANQTPSGQPVGPWCTVSGHPLLNRPSASAGGGGYGLQRWGGQGQGFWIVQWSSDTPRGKSLMSTQSPNSPSKASMLMMNLTQIMKISTKMKIMNSLNTMKPIELLTE